MPRYKFPLANGKHLVLEGDSMPSDADIEAAADSAGVRALLVSAEGEGPATDPSISPSNATELGPLGVGIANAARRGVERVGLQAATSPNLGRVIGLIAKPAASKVASSAIGGVIGGVPGAIVGAAMPTAALARGGARLAEAGIRNSAATVAKAAGSRVAQALTGPGALLATMPFTDAGDRPVGETAATTNERQKDFARMFQERVNREAGRQVITGTTTTEILQSIKLYRNQR